MAENVRVEYASERKLRHRNKVTYRLAHWPIWITVFFLAPGPLIFRLFGYGFNWALGAWLGVVLAGTGVAALRGRLPGVEPCPYIIRFTEDRPNPLYRRICYTLAWSELICYAAFNAAGLLWAVSTGEWRLETDLRLRMVSCRGNSVGAGGLGTAAACESVNSRRGT